MLSVVGERDTSSSHSLEVLFWPLNLPWKPPGVSRALSLQLPTGRRDGIEHSQPLGTARAKCEGRMVLPGDGAGFLGSPAPGSSLTGDGYQVAAVLPEGWAGAASEPQRLSASPRWQGLRMSTHHGPSTRR